MGGKGVRGRMGGEVKVWQLYKLIVLSGGATSSFLNVICGINCAFLQWNLTHQSMTRKLMVPITGRAKSFLLFYFRGGGDRIKNRPFDLPKVITFSTDFKYTTQS